MQCFELLGGAYAYNICIGCVCVCAFDHAALSVSCVLRVCDAVVLCSYMLHGLSFHTSLALQNFNLRAACLPASWAYHPSPARKETDGREFSSVQQFR